ncbi:MAG: phosphoglycerate dehydrogenase [Clostridiales bacterium]|jgi:D-3-phosphoglycerate dehydrogenase|nr:phosphoglycerate dehydrogenase [Clostridiales bacterium]
MFNIKTLNKIAECGTQELPGDRFFVSPEVENPDGILLRSYVMEEKDLTPNLLAIGRAGAGTNNIPVDKCAEKGIVVFNTPGANANAVKELVIAGLLLASRKISAGINWAQSLNGQTGVAKLVEKGKAEFTGPEIAGKKLGVIGLGAIGGLVANLCRHLGMHVIGYDPYLSVEAAWNLSRGVHKAANEDALYAECDYLTIHAPSNAETKHKFNAEFFAKCKKGIRILNFSRAELFDNDALKQAIADGIVECYVTDFPTEDLLGNEKIITIPHLGASTPESEDNCATMAGEQLREYILYGNIKNSVNFPDCEMPVSGRKRICIIHKNVPNVIGRATSALASKGFNIDNMVNKSKGDYAYTLINVDDGDMAGIEDTLKALDAVVRVRVI